MLSWYLSASYCRNWWRPAPKVLHNLRWSCLTRNKIRRDSFLSKQPATHRMRRLSRMNAVSWASHYSISSRYGRGSNGNGYESVFLSSQAARHAQDVNTASPVSFRAIARQWRCSANRPYCGWDKRVWLGFMPPTQIFCFCTVFCSQWEEVPPVAKWLLAFKKFNLLTCTFSH